MIAVEFAPACPSVWHRAVLELVLAGRWSDIPGAGWPPLVWFAAPAAAVTALALLAAMWKRPRSLILVLGLSAFASLWLPLALAPLLLATRPWPPMEQWRTTLAVAAALTLGAFVATPSCDRAVDGFALADPALIPALVFASIGVGGAALLVADAVFGRGSRVVQTACVVAALMTTVIAVMVAGADRPSLVGVLTALAWSRALAGGRQLLQWQTTAGGRAGMILLLMLVPLPAAIKAARPGFQDTDPPVRDVWRALERIQAPAAVVSTGGRADIAAEVWRARESPAQRSAVLLPLVPQVVAAELARRDIYVWAGPGEVLATRGFLVAPGKPPQEGTAPLARLIDYTPCRALSTTWLDVQGIASEGQFTAVMPEVAPLRGGLLYLAASRHLVPRPIDWPAEALNGFEVTTFDRHVPAEAEALAAALDRDEFDAGRIGDGPFVYRVRFHRLATSGETLRIALGGRADTAWARLYAREDPQAWRRPSVCLSRAGFTVAGYPGAPSRLSMDLSAPQVVGSGWHAFEGANQNGFRWTSDTEAEVFFLVHEPRALTLHIDAEPATGSWATANMRVTVNNVEARCSAATMPCDWSLPIEAMRRGLNVVTLHAATMQAPAPDPRQLGLRVNDVSVSAASPTR